jgi:hypothetical protein
VKLLTVISAGFLGGFHSAQTLAAHMCVMSAQHRTMSRHNRTRALPIGLSSPESLPGFCFSRWSWKTKKLRTSFMGNLHDDVGSQCEMVRAKQGATAPSVNSCTMGSRIMCWCCLLLLDGGPPYELVLGVNGGCGFCAFHALISNYHSVCRKPAQSKNADGPAKHPSSQCRRRC